MNIFGRSVIQEGTIVQAAPEYFFECGLYCAGVLRAQDAGSFQALTMGDARANVDGKQPAVKAERAIEFGEPRICLARKAAAPKFFCFLTHVFAVHCARR